MPYDADALATETSEAADDGHVLTKSAVPRQRNEIGNQGRDIIEAMGTLRMASDLGFLPGRELRVQLLERLCRFVLQAGDLFADRARTVRASQRSQFCHLGLPFCPRLFEIPLLAHWAALSQFSHRDGCPLAAHPN